MNLADVKLYLRVTNDIEDSLIERFMAVADSYVRDAVTDYDTKASDERFKSKSEMCQMALIAELYENRNQGGQEPKDYGFTIRTLIVQMQYWGGD